MLSSRGKFVTSAVCGLLGVVITGALIPDIGGLDLSEGAIYEICSTFPAEVCYGTAAAREGTAEQMMKCVFCPLNTAVCSQVIEGG